MESTDAFNSLFGNYFSNKDNSMNLTTRVKKPTDFLSEKKKEDINSVVKYSTDKTLKTDATSVRNLVPVSDIPLKYQSIFRSFPYFNIVQSTVFEDVFYTDKSLVVSAPTGSGKTVIFELGIIRLLMLISDMGQNVSNYKIVYMAPVKSLCNERYEDWKEKFTSLGAFCIQLTGDSDAENYFELQKYSIILTTPEKWDSITRVWKNNQNLVQTVKLLLVDEVHLLNEEERGATLEAALSRMKTIQSLLMGNNIGKTNTEPNLRFISVSATFPNVDDVSEWLSFKNCRGASYTFGEDLRPVHLKKIVLGYPCTETFSEFRFDLMLSYKLNSVIHMYSENKPTLVFCATRKSVVQTAGILSKATNFVSNSVHKQKLIEAANVMHDNKLRDCILNGIGFHHAGLNMADRRLVEEMFLMCQILVLISTSTLSMGVNFPAHLVVIKSTNQYAGGCYREYSDTQLLQMIGRAGRPQFDSNATAVIMTKSSLKKKYESMISGQQLVESSLHKHIVEHLNAEIVLGTITDVSIAMGWLKSTYLYQRVFKNPKHYGINMELSKEKIERKLQDMCIIELNGLRKYKLIYMDNDSFNVQPTGTGRLMAKYYLSFETMKQFSTMTGKENLSELLTLISGCKEFEDIQLRVNEKKLLNDLNKNKSSAIRFPLQDKIKTRAMKINCLAQASFGCLSISEPAFNQDIAKIFRTGVRISKCLSEYLEMDKGFSILCNAINLARCFKAKLWENSKHVSRQLDKIGVTLSTLLVNAGITSFKNLRRTNPRDIEFILNRNPPFGTYLVENVKLLPQYEVQVDQVLVGKNNRTSITITVCLINFDDLQGKKTTYENHSCHFLIGDADNNIILNKKIRDHQLLQMGQWCKKIDIMRANKGDEINIYLISDSYGNILIRGHPYSKFQYFKIVGLDIHKSFMLEYNSSIPSFTVQKEFKENEKKNYTSINKRSCTHKCLNKITCLHMCCKTGVSIPTVKKSNMESFFDQLNNKMNNFPAKKVKIGHQNFPTHEPVLLQSQLPIPNNEVTKQNAFYEEANEIECVTPSLDEMWDDEGNLQDFWSNVAEVDPMEETAPKAKEIDLPEIINFDVSFENGYLNGSKSTVNYMESMQSKSIENLESNDIAVPIRIYEEKEQRKIWTKEQQRDPAAQEELYHMVLNYLCTY